jgi:hypothetical protein
MSMSEESSPHDLSCVSQQCGTTHSPTVPVDVPVERSLSSQEVERICKCFIKLIAAKERKPDDHKDKRNTNCKPSNH